MNLCTSLIHVYTLHNYFVSWYVLQGVPHQIRPPMGLNCDLRDKSENLRRMNHFKKFNKKNFVGRKNRFFEYYVR